MRLSCCIAFLLAVLLFTSACTHTDVPSDEPSEPANKTELEWPAELLPDGFPVAEYHQIYSVKQPENAVEIILFADKGPIFTFPTVTLFHEALGKQGYVYYYSYTAEDGSFINPDGYKVYIETSGNLESELAILNEKSPTGFTYSITVEKTDENVDYLFWDYPAPDTDLGFEERVFDTWPSKYLPDCVPAPSPDADFTIEKMEMRKNGLFITIKGSVEATGNYLLSVCQSGFVEVNNISINRDGDYFFVQDLVYPVTLTKERVMRFQFCKHTKQS